ncbi:ABC transporter permease [Spirosoma utsteinense]|uniref:ABC transporter permease n=1 Tax=Spirosoma utsteinense TaxID=2585773 RepID=UPI001EB0E412|nr:FtsX-like permease family protein [Spirosoma utsteinense]MBC3788661.1 ABC-type antimicrobial peptide transport system permease subunit [Spirosoma utsteinense]
MNETAVRQLGFVSAQAAVGQIIHWDQDYEIVGVVSDYHHKGLRQVIEPVIFLPARSAGNLTVYLTTDQIQAKMAQLEQLYKAAYPSNPFEFFFVEERYNNQYKSEQQYGKLFTISAALAIFIACLGLFGLTSFTTEQRIKEIGIRKVLGASVIGIVRLLSQDFLKLVVLSVIIASPIAWWAMSWWLQDFAYKINLEWWVFMVAAFMAVSIAFVTISFQSIKAALTNPISSLRSE